jgi:uncharacterized membrane protein YraQ (UPF0718 family)
LFTVGLYILTITLVVVSLSKDHKKTEMALKKVWKSLENILPQFLAIILIIGIILAVLSPQDISRIIGRQSGWIGMITAAIIGSITLIPGFVAFPLTAALLKNGGGLMQIVVFISTLMMVGVVTAPLEMEYFGKKITFLRNGLAFALSFIIAILMGVMLK